MMMQARFEPLSEVITGGYARVQRVRDHLSGLNVALKRPVVEIGEAAKQCALEIEVLGAVQHSHLVRLLDHGVDEEGSFAVLEWIEGESLHSRLAKGPMTEFSVRALLAALAAALRAVHGAGFVHGDVSADNLLLSRDDHATLIDLGNAARLGEPKPLLTGSIYSMAPELFESKPPGIATDGYALGVLAYQALSGERPFQGETKAQVITAHHRHLRVPLSERCTISSELGALIEALISVRPEDRATALRLLNLAC